MTSRYPDDPEAWFALGEANNHLVAYTGRTYAQQLEAFDRVIALDSAYAPAYIHPIEVSALAGAEAMRRYLRPYLALTPVDVNADGARLVQRLLDSAGAAADLDARLQGISDQGLFGAHLALSRLPDTTELDVGITRFMARHPLSFPPINTPRAGTRALARALMNRGHLKAGYAALPDDETGPLFAEAALLGGVPAEIAAAGVRPAALGGHRGVRGARRRLSLVGGPAGHRVSAPRAGARRFAGAVGAARRPRFPRPDTWPAPPRRTSASPATTPPAPSGGWPGCRSMAVRRAISTR